MMQQASHSVVGPGELEHPLRGRSGRFRRMSAPTDNAEAQLAAQQLPVPARPIPASAFFDPSLDLVGVRVCFVEGPAMGRGGGGSGWGHWRVYAWWHEYCLLHSRFLIARTNAFRNDTRPHCILYPLTELQQAAPCIRPQWAVPRRGHTGQR